MESRRGIVLLQDTRRSADEKTVVFSFVLWWVWWVGNERSSIGTVALFLAE